MPNDALNRRKEQRLPLHDLSLQIRQRGGHYQACRSVDLSLNGLAFISDGLQFGIPEKIDFILTIEGHEIQGSGVICNRRRVDGTEQYGLMFIQVSPEISDILAHGELSTRELENLSRNMAEQFALSLLAANDARDRQIWFRQQQLLDAVRAYLLRLGEMGAKMPSPQGQAIAPAAAVKIERNLQGDLALHWLDADGAVRTLRIDLAPQTLSVAYQIDGELMDTALQVLELLSHKIGASVTLNCPHDSA